MVADVLPFGARKAVRPAKLTLCRNGHHKWKIMTADPFAVHRGELITRYRCERCGREKNKAQ